MTPTVGRIVHILVHPTINNGSDTAAAVVTKVHGPELVNVRALFDRHAVPGEWIESVTLHADESAAREAQGEIPEFMPGAHAFWPAQVG